MRCTINSTSDIAIPRKIIDLKVLLYSAMNIYLSSFLFFRTRLSWSLFLFPTSVWQIIISTSYLQIVGLVCLKCVFTRFSVFFFSISHFSCLFLFLLTHLFIYFLFVIGVRPFGVSSMLAGFGADGSPQIYLNDPAGTYSAWKVSCSNIICLKVSLFLSLVLKLLWSFFVFGFLFMRFGFHSWFLCFFLIS